jgi:DNA-directed RNA polymerase subunit RPC12/RpoP
MEQDKPNQKPSESVIRFNCAFCGRQIRVSSIHAGKKAKCPHCRNVVIIPQSPPSHTPQQDEPIFLKQDPVKPADTEMTKDQQYQMLRDAAGLPPLEPPPPPERKFPALIDIFLYPANVQGLIFLAIAVLLPMLIRVISLFLCLFGIILSLFIAVIEMYVYWYLAQCVRDSAAGSIRAPDTLAETPGIWELLWQLFELLACLAVCAAPVAVYYGFTHRIDLTFWILAGSGAFLYPMTLLGVLMFDSINGLNPIIIIPSIFSTIFQYCGLVILIGAILFLLVQTQRILQPGFLGFVLYPLLQAAELYLAMIAAHLLGRFYFKYQEKLNWEV